MAVTRDYIEAAMSHATYEWRAADQLWHASIAPLPDVHVSGREREPLTAELRAALEGWIVETLWAGALLPPIDGIEIPIRILNPQPAPTAEDQRIADEITAKLAARRAHT